MTTPLSTPSTATQRLLTHTEKATRSHRSRAARALDVEATADGTQVWHVRSPYRRVLSSMPMPHEVTSLAEARECLRKAEAIAAHHSSRSSMRSMVVSFVVRPLVVAISTVGLSAAGVTGTSAAPHPVVADVAHVLTAAAALIAVGLVVFFALQFLSNPPQVWARRVDAYKKRVTELDVPAARRRRFPWPSRV